MCCLNLCGPLFFSAFPKSPTITSSVDANLIKSSHLEEDESRCLADDEDEAYDGERWSLPPVQNTKKTDIPKKRGRKRKHSRSSGESSRVPNKDTDLDITSPRTKTKALTRENKITKYLLSEGNDTPQQKTPKKRKISRLDSESPRSQSTPKKRALSSRKSNNRSAMELSSDGEIISKDSVVEESSCKIKVNRSPKFQSCHKRKISEVAECDVFETPPKRKRGRPSLSSMRERLATSPTPTVTTPKVTIVQ